MSDEVDARRWDFDRVSHQMVPVYTSSEEEEETEESAKATVVLGLFKKAKERKETPCLNCCVKAGGKRGKLCWLKDVFFPKDGMQAHTKVVHRKLKFECDSCYNVFPTEAELVEHKSMLPKDH